MSRRVRACLSTIAVVGIAAITVACAPTPRFGPASLDTFRGTDGLLHDRDVEGLDGGTLREGSIIEGLWTTASALRLLQTSGHEPRLDETAADAVDAAALEAVAGTADVDLLVGVARVCALSSHASDPCARARAAATELLDGPAGAVPAARDVTVIEAASDLGLQSASPVGMLAGALERAADDECVESAAIRHRVRLDLLTELSPAVEPRELTEAVLSALRDGDIDRAHCLSGIVAATAGATPERDEDWLREPFDDVVDAGFDHADDGRYTASDRGRGRVETTRMLSQVSFDLSVELR